MNLVSDASTLDGHADSGTAPCPRLALIATLFPPGGGGAALVHYQLCKQFGGEVHALVPAVSGPEAARFDRDQPFPIVRLPFLGARDSKIKWRWLRAFWNIVGRRLLVRVPLTLYLILYLLRIRPDVVCIGGLASLYWIVPLIRLTTRARVIFYIHGEEISASRGLGPVTRWFYKRSVAALRKADTVVSVSSWTNRQILALGIAPEKAKVNYNGLDHERFSLGPVDDQLVARHQLAGKRTILTVARLDARKGHDTVLRAIPEVLKTVPNLAYVIVGDGPQRPALENLVNSLGIAEHVVFVKGVTDAELPAYYRTCEVFVQPNRRMPNGDDEGFGLVYVEAGACGRPVIGGRSGGVPEAVLDGQTGLLVNGESVDETADAIIQLLTNPDLSNRLATQGRSRSLRFDWRRTAAQFRSMCAAEEPRKTDLTTASNLCPSSPCSSS